MSEINAEVDVFAAFSRYASLDGAKHRAAWPYGLSTD